MRKETKKAPTIRFRGFTDDWEQRKLGELSSSFEYGLNAAAKKYDGKNKYIRITDINDNSRLFEQENITSPDIDLSSAGNYKLSERDILFARTGASVGKSYIYRASDGCVYYAGFLVRARIKPEYNPEFIFQNTLTADYKKFITVTSMRSGQPGVNAQEYSQYQIMIPSKLEQDKISRYLRNLDNLITLHQRKLNLLKTLMKYFLQNMFPAKGEKIPGIRFKGFTGDWEQRKLGELTNILSASRVHRNEWTEDGVPFFRSSDVISAFKGEENQRAFISFELYEKLSASSGRLEKDDILITGGGSIGIPYIVPNNDPLYSKDADLIWIKHASTFDSNYLYTYFTNRNFRDYISSISHVGTIAHYTIEQVKATPIVMPSLEEQKHIGDYFSNLNFLITLHQQKLNQLQMMKKFMLQNLFI